MVYAEMVNESFFWGGGTTLLGGGEVGDEGMKPKTNHGSIPWAQTWPNLA